MCTICFDHYRDPKILSCLHYIVLRRLPPATGGARWPAGNLPRVPPGGHVRRRAGSILTPFFVNCMIGLHERVVKEEGRAEALCELCKSMGKAEAFCRQCERFVCGDCVILNTHD